MISDALIPQITEEYLEAHGIMKRFQGVSFESIEERGVPEQVIRQYDAVLDYASNLKRNIENGTGLVLAGGYGLMKTTLAVAVLRRLLETDLRGSGYIIPVVSLIDNLYTMRAMDKEEAALYESKIRKADILILDDLGGENVGQGWVMSKVDSIITERYNRLKPVIVTTNLDQKSMAETYGGRMIDRLRSASRFITFAGRSLRDTVK